MIDFVRICFKSSGDDFPVVPCVILLLPVYYNFHYYSGGKQYYFCVVMDLFSGKIVGYKISNKDDTAFVAETTKEAFLSRGKPKNLMFHSNAGVQYTSKEFFCLLKSKDVIQSVSRPGTPLDNAVAESFFATFKKEELYHREYHTYEELRKGIDEYILFYNQIRPHKKLKYVSPCEFEEAYYRNLQKKRTTERGNKKTALEPCQRRILLCLPIKNGSCRIWKF